MCEVSNLQTSPNSEKTARFWGTFGELKLKKALQVSVTPFSAEREGVFSYSLTHARDICMVDLHLSIYVFYYIFVPILSRFSWVKVLTIRVLNSIYQLPRRHLELTPQYRRALS